MKALIMIITIQLIDCAIVKLRQNYEDYDLGCAEMPDFHNFPSMQNMQRVIDGDPVGQPLPYQLQLRLHESFYCSAVLISPSFALTAHHCFYRKIENDKEEKIDKEHFTVYAGAETNDDMFTQERKILKHIQLLHNAEVKIRDRSPDIVLIQLDKPHSAERRDNLLLIFST